MEGVLVEIDVAGGPGDGLVLGLFQGFLEFAVQKVGLDFLVFGALLEECLAAGLLSLKQLRSVVEVWGVVLLGWRGVVKHLAEPGVNREPRAAARAIHLPRHLAMAAHRQDQCYAPGWGVSIRVAPECKTGCAWRALAKRSGRAYTGPSFEGRRQVMKMISRREAGRTIVAAGVGLLAANRGASGLAKIDSVVSGVALGSQSYSFRDRDLDACIEGFRAVGLGECELWDAHTAPRRYSGDELTRWRLETPLRHFEQVRKKFDDAGVHPHALTCNLRRESSDQEIQRVFEMARALGVNLMTSSTNVSIAPRVDTYARKYKIKFGFHGHDATDKPDEFSTPETFERAMKGASEYICINLDIGHFTAANGDAVEYIRQHHDRIVTLHIKDRKKNHGANLPFGHGDTPIGPVLRLLRDQKWKIHANIEYEYGEETKGLDTLTEMKKCYEFCRKALEA